MQGVTVVSDAAIVRLTLADYVAADQAGKVNMIGGGVSVVPRVSDQKDSAGLPLSNTTAFGLVATLAVGPELYGAECSVTLTLEDSQGDPVPVPGPDGRAAEPLDITNQVVFAEPQFAPPLSVPQRTLRSRAQWILMFPNGVPLPIGARYVWRLSIDGKTRDDWTEEFYVSPVGLPEEP